MVIATKKRIVKITIATVVSDTVSKSVSELR